MRSNILDKNTNPLQTMFKNNARLSFHTQTGVFRFYTEGSLQSRQFLFYFDDFV